MIAISACLLGLNCRYDGKNKRDDNLLREIDCLRVIPFCPEVNILGSPREMIDLFKIDGKIVAIGSMSQRDYSDLIEREAKRFIKFNPKIDTFYMKAKSPSCALYSARVYDKDYNLIDNKSVGLFAKFLKIWYKEAKFIER